MPLVARRLPGIRVDAAPPRATEMLPRMDVAVFVGFASTGPLHRPVVVESVATFAAVFGADAPLAWDEARGERLLAHLGPAVRAFFSNGGTRCWIIRVARSAALESVRSGVSLLEAASRPGVATTNRFPMPGVLAADGETGETAAAQAQARCEGSWSDGIRLAAALTQRSFAVDHVQGESVSPGRAIELHTRQALRPGDLLALGGTGELTVYATVDAVQAAGDSGAGVRVGATLRGSFERLTVGAPAEWHGSAVVRGYGDPLPATLFAPVSTANVARLRLDAPIAATVERGHWAQWYDGSQRIWLRIDEIEREPVFIGSPPELSTAVSAMTFVGPAWVERGAFLPAAEIRSAQLLTMEIQVVAGGTTWRVHDVGLTAAHPRGWWSYRSDAEQFGGEEDADADVAADAVPTDAPRFPLAAIESGAPVAWLPLGLDALFSPAVGALPAKGTALERDGLAEFDATLFVDPELASVRLPSLTDAADGIRYLREPTRALMGMHAALAIGAGGVFNEATLLAIPDAIHPGWTRRAAEAEVPVTAESRPAPAEWSRHRGACLDADGDAASVEGPDFGGFIDCGTRAVETPVLDGPDAPVAPGRYRLAWNDAEPGGEYLLLEAVESDLSDAREIYRGSDTEYVAYTEREGSYHYQVYVSVGGDRSAGSNIVTVGVRRDDWVVRVPSDADDDLSAQWLAIHRAALRLAAASGELLATLAMPRHFRGDQAVRYAKRLRDVKIARPGGAVVHDVDAFDYAESRALSFGALYFPWLQARRGTPSEAPRVHGRQVDTLLRVVPPDGVAAGMLASRARTRGAWIAPANEPLHDVVAVTPVVPDRDWQALQDAQVNLVRTDPRGIYTLSADTLALDPELTPINVRRLMILLRRLALRRGDTYLFEPHGPTLRRAVERSFTELLTMLFRRGAFAGASAAQAFRVVVDDTVNTSQDVEHGRVAVELRVAPAVPMRFLSVRLLQTGERLTVVEEL